MVVPGRHSGAVVVAAVVGFGWVTVGSNLARAVVREAGRHTAAGVVGFDAALHEG